MSTHETYVHEVGERGARWLRSPHAGLFLGVISFAESLFVPILIDPFLIALVLAKREAWVRYVIISVTCSVAGGVGAYFLGAWFFDMVGSKFIAFYSLEDSFKFVSDGLDSNGFVFVLLGALTPIPYKLVAVAAGLTKVSFMTFLFASVFGRILRLGLVGYAAYAVGPHALPLIQKHLLTLAYIFGFILTGYLVLKFI